MRDERLVKEQILEHLKFYKDLGVRWVGGSPLKKPRSNSRPEKKPAAAAPSKPGPAAATGALLFVDVRPGPGNTGVLGRHPGRLEGLPALPAFERPEKYSFRPRQSQCRAHVCR